MLINYCCMLDNYSLFLYSFYSPLGSWLRTTVYKRSFDGQIQAIEQPLGLVTTFKYDDRSILAFEGTNFEKPLKFRDEVINKLELQGDEVSQNILQVLQRTAM